MFFPFIGTAYSTDGLAEDTWSSWASAKHAVPNTTTWWTTNDSTWEITGLQLEVGSQATSFEHRSFGEELRFCQRYYFKLPYQGNSSAGGLLIGTGKETGSSARICVPLPVSMRTIPSCAASDLLADDEVSATSANTVSQVIGSNVEPDRLLSLIHI